MPDTCGLCGSPILVRDGRSLSVIDGSFIAERNALKAKVERYREALQMIFEGPECDAPELAREALEGTGS